MQPTLSDRTIRLLGGTIPPDRDAWFAFLSDDCVLRIGSEPAIYGRRNAEARLTRFLARVRSFGRCGCDVVGGPDLWLIETDLSFNRPDFGKPVPCAISIRSAQMLVRDLRFYLIAADDV